MPSIHKIKYRIKSIYVVILIAGYCYYFMFRSMRDEAKTGMEAMFGKEGVVIEDIDPEGKIEFRNDIWSATAASSQKIFRGERVTILGAKGLVLTVAEIHKNNKGQNT